MDDPLPITVETTAALLKGGEANSVPSLKPIAKASVIKANGMTLRILAGKFGHSPALAARTVEEYLVCMDGHDDSTSSSSSTFVPGEPGKS